MMRLKQVREDWTTLGSADPLWAVLVTPEGRHNGWSPPDFYATGRREIDDIFDHLAELGVSIGTARGLDYGCGAARLTVALADHVERVVGVDISATMLDVARELGDDRCEFIENGTTRLSFADESFDVAVSSLVIQHLPPRIARVSIAELLRVTRPGGVVVVQVATRPDLSWRGVLTRVLPVAGIRVLQRRVLGYPAPMNMYATPRTTIDALCEAGGARVADAVEDRMYGGHWRYTRYYLRKNARAALDRRAPAQEPTAVGPPATSSEPASHSVTGDHESATAQHEAATADPAPDAPPTPIRSWLRARPERPVWVTAAALVLLQAIVRGVLAYRGTFYLDDLAFTGRAAHYPLWSAKFLLHPYVNHLMPGSFVWVWLVTKIWPLSYAPVATIDIALQAVLAVLIYKLLRDLFGSRPAVLVPFALAVLTPITLPAFLWWAAALNQLPQQIAMVVALRCQVSYLRTGRTRSGVLGACAVAGGLLFSEKTLLAVPLIVGLTLCHFHGGGLAARLRSAARAHARVWCAYLLVAVPYAVYYQVVVPSPVRGTPSGQDVLNLAQNSYGHALFPGLLGGPWSWRPIGWVGALADPDQTETLLAFVVVAAFLIVTVVARSGAVLGWLLAFGYTVLDLVLLATSRAELVGPLVGNEYRYLTDASLVVILGATLATLPLRVAPGAGARPGVEVQRLRPRRQSWPALSSPIVREVRLAFDHVPAMAGAAAIIVVVAASCLYSSVRYDRYWNHNPVRAYLANARHDLADLPDRPVVADTEVPDDVAWKLLYPYDLDSRLLAPLPDVPRFLPPGAATDALSIFDASGHLRVAGVHGVSASVGPHGTCGWFVARSPVRVHLQSKTYPGSWVVRVGYLASAESPVRVHAGTTTVRVTLHPGLHTLYLSVSGVVDSVDFGRLSNGASLCTSDVTVGEAVAIPGTIVSS